MVAEYVAAAAARRRSRAARPTLEVAQEVARPTRFAALLDRPPRGRRARARAPPGRGRAARGPSRSCATGSSSSRGRGHRLAGARDLPRAELAASAGWSGPAASRTAAPPRAVRPQPDRAARRARVRQRRRRPRRRGRRRGRDARARAHGDARRAPRRAAPPRRARHAGRDRWYASTLGRPALPHRRRRRCAASPRAARRRRRWPRPATGSPPRASAPPVHATLWSSVGRAGMPLAP